MGSTKGSHSFETGRCFSEVIELGFTCFFFFLLKNLFKNDIVRALEYLADNEKTQGL